MTLPSAMRRSAPPCPTRSALRPSRLAVALLLGLLLSACSVGTRTSASDALSPVVRVSDTDRAPFHSICQMTIVRRRGLLFSKTYVSSAALLGRRHLLTAAHNLHSTRWSNVRTADAQCAVDAPGRWALPGAFARDGFEVAEGYSWSDFSRDYGVATLSAEAPYDSRFRLPLAGERGAVVGSTVHVAGFPASEGFESGRLYYGTGTVTALTDATFSYAVDTGGGMSGSPVWVVQCSGPVCEYVVVGVHVGFADGQAVARRVDEPALVRAVAAWTRSPSGAQ